jgi:hypothetical protein
MKDAQIHVMALAGALYADAMRPESGIQVTAYEGVLPLLHFHPDSDEPKAVDIFRGATVDDLFAGIGLELGLEGAR